MFYIYTGINHHMKLNITINKSYSAWKDHNKINKHFVKKVLRNIADYHSNINADELEISLLLCNDSEISILNKQFRNYNSPTNVLSFPDSDIELFCQDISLKQLYLGDVALSYDTISKEAKMSNKKFEDHFTHLLIHGILHLLGYTHDKETNANIMERLEVQLLSKFGITSPYELINENKI